MKQWYAGVLVACLIVTPDLVGAPEKGDSTEAAITKEIRMLEEQEVQAVLDHDVAALERLWDKAYVVHNPEGRIVLAGRNVMDRPVMQNTRASFVREVERIVVQGDVVFSMGNETVASTGSAEVIKRRYTNVWMKKDGAWKLVARHANKICSKN